MDTLSDGSGPRGAMAPDHGDLGFSWKEREIRNEAGVKKMAGRDRQAARRCGRGELECGAFNEQKRDLRLAQSRRLKEVMLLGFSLATA